MSKQFFLFIGLFSGAMIHTQADAMLLVDGRYVRNIFDRGDFREPDYSGDRPINIGTRRFFLQQYFRFGLVRRALRTALPLVVLRIPQSMRAISKPLSM